jgi:hypothetical protein
MAEFMQGFNTYRAHRLLDSGKRSSCLVYRLLDTGEEVQVPNIWYNQPVEWRIRAMRWYIERDEACLAKQLREAEAADWDPAKRSSWLFLADQTKRQLIRVYRLVAEMETTGQVLA